MGIRSRFAILAMLATLTFGVILVGCGNGSAGNTDNSTTASSEGVSSSNGSSSSTPDSADDQVIHVTAKNFAWSFDKTTVKKGKPVKLIVTATEGSHGLTIEGTPIKDVPAVVGQTKEVIFTPDKAGDLMVMCTHYCGAGHSDMHTTLTVVD